MFPLVGAIELSPAVAIVGLVVVALGGLAVGKLLWKDDRALKQFQRECNDLAQLLAKFGFQLLPPILTDIALGDIPQLGSDIRHAAKVLSDPAMRSAELTTLLKGLVEEQLNNPKTAQVFLDDVVAAAVSGGYTPSKSALGGASDDSLLDAKNPVSPVTINVHSTPTGTEAAAGAAAESSTVVK